MQMRFLKKISLIIIPVIIVFFVLNYYNHYLDEQLNRPFNDVLGHTYAANEIDKGIVLIQKASEKNNLLLLGSSELSTPFPQHPKFMFPNTQLNTGTTMMGQAYTQSLINTLHVAALPENAQKGKVVIIVSLQWFIGSEISAPGFQRNFSELQYYHFMNSTTIPEDIKKYVSVRIKQLSGNRFEQAYLYADLYNKDNAITQTARTIMRPYYMFREYFLTLKDKHTALKALKKTEAETPLPSQTKEIDWEKEYAIAEKSGKESCTNNPFNVNDAYYTEYLAPQIDALKDSNIWIDLLGSKEFSDYEILLKTLKAQNIKPYFVFAPTNGYYYDYIGITADKRHAFYDKLAAMTATYGFDYLDLRDKEYEPYFLTDVMHLGWKGWLYIEQQIIDYFSKNQ